MFYTQSTSAVISGRYKCVIRTRITKCMIKCKCAPARKRLKQNTMVLLKTRSTISPSKNRTPVLVIKTSVSTSSSLLGNQIRISHSLMDAVKKNWIIILIWLGGYKKWPNGFSWSHSRSLTSNAGSEALSCDVHHPVHVTAELVDIMVTQRQGLWRHL